MKNWGDLDAAFEKAHPPDEPGGAFGVFRHGRALYMRGYGSKRLGHKDRIGPRTVFDIASVSKQFTAFCILLLQERGRLSMEDDFRKHLPEFDHTFSGIKIRHLVHHSSGLLGLLDLRWLDTLARAWEPGSPGYLALGSKQKDRNFPAGQEHQYCNDGYVLLAEIIRRRSGLSLAEFAETKIFRPLNMTRTRFVGPGEARMPDHSEGHRLRKGRWEPSPRFVCTPGPGGLWTCIEDLGRWAKSLDEQSLGSPALYRAQLRPGKILLPSLDAPYAAGLFLDPSYGRLLACHNGGIPGFSSAFYWFPRQELSVVLLRNRESDPGLSASTVLDFVLKSTKSQAKAVPAHKTKFIPGPASPALKSTPGLYQGVHSADLWELKSKRKGLLLNRGFPVRLVRTTAGRLSDPHYGTWWSVRLEPDASGTWQLRHYGGSKLLGILSRLGKTSAKIPGLASLRGHYHNASTGKRFDLRVVGAKLFYRDAYPDAYPDIPLRWLAPDKLVYTSDRVPSVDAYAQLDGNGYFQVQRDSRGKALGLLAFIPSNGCRRLRFAKKAKQ